MSTPGFTAHNSLYQSNRHYVAGLISSWSPSAKVVPLFRAPIKFPQGEGGDCHERCGPCLGNCTQSCINTCFGDAPPYPKPCCLSTETCCSGKCVNTTSDKNNCGACGQVCSGGFCKDGLCWACEPGFTQCGDKCIDTTSDRANCGACGKVCADRSICYNGACVKCSKGATRCGNECTDLSWDANNCGACGVGCSTGICSGGVCSTKCGNGYCPVNKVCLFGEFCI